MQKLFGSQQAQSAISCRAVLSVELCRSDLLRPQDLLTPSASPVETKVIII